MRSLFLKILLWFGLAMVLVNVASFVMGVVTERRAQPPRTNPLAPMFGVYAESAVDTWEREGASDLAAYLQRVEQASHINAVLLNERGEEVSGRAVPAGARELTTRLSGSKPFAFEFPESSQTQPQQERSPLAAQLVRSRQGALYTLVGKLPPPDFPRPPPRFGDRGSLGFGLRQLGRSLVHVLLIGGLLCYWLARNLVTPIVKLRDTTHSCRKEISARAWTIAY